MYTSGVKRCSLKVLINLVALWAVVIGYVNMQKNFTFDGLKVLQPAVNYFQPNRKAQLGLMNTLM
jgi:hypothetical protein